MLSTFVPKLCPLLSLYLLCIISLEASFQAEKIFLNKGNSTHIRWYTWDIKFSPFFFFTNLPNQAQCVSGYIHLFSDH